jgi:hypothetical protein
MNAEHRQNPEPPADLANVLRFGPWREAKTYRRTWPHEYQLRKDLDPGEQRVFVQFVEWFDRNAYEGRFRDRVVFYVDFDGFTFWRGYPERPAQDEKLINRCVIEESYMFLEAHGLVDQRLQERRRRNQQ